MISCSAKASYDHVMESWNSTVDEIDFDKEKAGSMYGVQVTKLGKESRGILRIDATCAKSAQ